MQTEAFDDYSHLDPEIYYVPESIPCSISEKDADTHKINNDYNSQLQNCFCIINCDIECACILKKCAGTQDADVQTFPYILNNAVSEMVLSECFLDFNIPIYECNSQCMCEKSCRNRLVQFGPRKYLIVKKSQQYNSLGLFTSSSVPQGGFICEYAGEIISKLEALKRNKFNSSHKHMNYIICVNEYVGSNKIQTFVDPSKFGNIGRYLNHSCEPNCRIIPIRVDTPIPKLCIFAVKNIVENSELTFDYGIFSDKSIIPENKVVCLCKSENCLKWLPFSKYD